MHSTVVNHLAEQMSKMEGLWLDDIETKLFTPKHVDDFRCFEGKHVKFHTFCDFEAADWLSSLCELHRVPYVQLIYPYGEHPGIKITYVSGITKITGIDNLGRETVLLSDLRHIRNLCINAENLKSVIGDLLFNPTIPPFWIQDETL